MVGDSVVDMKISDQLFSTLESLSIFLLLFQHFVLISPLLFFN